MAATETRLLVLGAVRLFEPVNGYQIRRELLSWKVEEWAYINPGSIYSSLTTMTKQGYLCRHDLVDGTREVAVYTTTAAGRGELDELFGRAVQAVRALDPLPLHTAMSLCSLFDRQTVARHLDVRRSGLDLHLAELEEQRALAATGIAPPHIVRILDLQIAGARAEQQWVVATLDEIASGGLAFAGEPMRWQPAADDPGWQMHQDSERYRALLGLDT